MRGLATVVIAVVAVAMPARAEADDALTRARKALDASDYAGAKAALDEALASGTNGRTELVDLYRLAGIVQGSLGDAAAATEAFERLLALAPEATLPPKLSHRISDAFDSARIYYKDHQALAVTAETTVEPPTVTLVIGSDPLAMVARVRVTLVSGGSPGQTIEGTGTGRITLALPKSARLELRVAALDSHGNRLVEVGTTDAPLVITVGGKPIDTRKPPPHHEVGHPPPPSGPPAAPHLRPLYAQWWLWGGVAAACAVTGSLFVVAGHSASNDLDSIVANSSSHTFTEAKDVEARLSRDVLVTNIAFGAAGAAAIAAVVLFVTAPHAGPSEHAVTTLRPVPVRGGGGFSLEVPF